MVVPAYVSPDLWILYYSFLSFSISMLNLYLHPLKYIFSSYVYCISYSCKCVLRAMSDIFHRHFPSYTFIHEQVVHIHSHYGQYGTELFISSLSLSLFFSCIVHCLAKIGLTNCSDMSWWISYVPLSLNWLDRLGLDNFNKEMFIVPW